MRVNYRQSYPLLSKLVLYIFFFALSLSLLVTIVQLYMAFTVQKNEIRDSLEKIQENQLQTLINNVWGLDERAIPIQLQSILEDPDIVYIWLQYEPDAGDLLEYGVKPSTGQEVISKQYDLSLEVEGEMTLIGRVGFVATTEKISSRLLAFSYKTLLAELVTIIATCLFTLILFIYFYSRHINHIVNYTKQLKVGRLDQQLSVPRSKKNTSQPDEIDRIVDSLNSMRVRLQEEIHVQYLTEKNLIREKLFSDAIINSTPGIFFVMDEQLKIVRFNRSYSEFFGISENATDSIDFISFVPEGQQREVKANGRKIFETKEPMVKEVFLYSGSGKKTPFLLSAQLLETEESKFLIGTGTDLSEQKRMEARLRQAQKMESLGTLAGGISHDFNNILSAIVGYTTLAKLQCKDDEKLQGYLGTVTEATERAKTLVQQILSFSRKTETFKQPIQISAIVAEAMKLLRSSLPSIIQVNQTIDSNLSVVADSTEIHQVVMNLCTNAFHAMEEQGGILSVTVSERIVTENDCFPELDIVNGTYLSIEISDTGHGIDEETKLKIFEPYFTTKETGVGTGLGLAVTHGVVSSYGGHIYVYSQPGEGTTFTVYLPAVESGLNGFVQEETVVPKMVYGNGEHILIVDDERFIIDFYDDLLTRYGYKTTSFSSSNDALSHFELSVNAYDLIIADQVMPQMQGSQLAEKIWQHNGSVPVILCSGFSGALGRQHFLDLGFAAYIQKPVSGTELLQTISETLNKQ